MKLNHLKQDGINSMICVVVELNQVVFILLQVHQEQVSVIKFTILKTFIKKYVKNIAVYIRNNINYNRAKTGKSEMIIPW